MASRRTRDGLEAFWAIALLALMAATFRLWLPTSWTGAGDYPAVPMFDLVTVGLTQQTASVLSIATTFVIAMACLVTVGVGRWRWVWPIIAVSLVIAVLLDQHRLQPWVYQSFLYAILFAISPRSESGRLPEATFRLIRLLTISVYVFSAAGKLDFQFLHTVGQDFLRVQLEWVGVDVSTWPTKTRLFAAAIFPAFELCVAIALCWPRTRMFGVWMATAMHVGLIAVLSPMGLGHSPGVIVWNVVMALQAWWLFAGPVIEIEDDAPINSDAKADAGRVGPRAWAVMGFAIAMPIFERAGYWDHWLSWALYSPHSSRVTLQIHESAIDRLPDEWRVAVTADDESDRWHDLNLGQLSLAVRGVPAVPQARYQWALADQIIEQAGIENQVRGKVQSASDRWTGKRDAQWWTRPDEFQKAGDAFWLVP
ncbi:MauE/DoxX family redox-associated membrane protein [Rhodopirellula bahusiensis]|uniref:MauE/DoxX family redox-associated membrane protein n=1 Tax=Rhodopirellula bahusiensis TaxID=2014065 RepID=UPI0032637473